VRQNGPYLHRNMAPQVEKTWTRLCESKHPHPRAPPSCKIEGAECPRSLGTSSLRVEDIVPTLLLLELLKCLLSLNRLAEQLGLGGHYFSHVGWRWRLLQLSTTTSTKTAWCVAGPLNYLQCGNFSLIRESPVPPRLSVISAENLELKDS
jgi:hypothetical protein